MKAASMGYEGGFASFTSAAAYLCSSMMILILICQSKANTNKLDLFCKEKVSEIQHVIQISDLLCKEKLSIEWNV